MTSARIAVVGAGAVGASFAAALWRAGRRDLVFCVRRPQATWRVEASGVVTVMTPTTATDPSQLPPVDWVLLATKAHQTESAAAWLRALTNDATRVAVLQNGIDHEARVRHFVTGAAIVPVIVHSSAERRAPDLVIAHRAPEAVVPATADGAAFAALFAGTDAAVTTRADFAVAAWEKLCLNAIGGISALTGVPLDLRSDELRTLAARMLNEITRVARAEGVVLEAGLADRLVARYRERPAHAPNSILADRLAGRALEFEARNAIVVRLAHAHGIDAPANEAVSALLGAVSPSAARP